MEKCIIDLSNSWIPKSSLHWIAGGAHGTLLSTILMYQQNLNFSYTPPPLKKCQKNVLMGPNIIHLMGESFDIHGSRSQ